MKSEIAEKRRKNQTFFQKKKKKFDPACRIKIPQEHNKRKETKISLLLSLSLLLLLEESKELLISLLLLVFDFTTIQTTIDTDDAQEERETTGITRQKERAD